MLGRLALYQSQGVDPYRNLAVEEYQIGRAHV